VIMRAAGDRGALAGKLEVDWGVHTDYTDNGEA